MSGSKTTAATIAKRGLSKVPGSLEILWSLHDFARNKWGQPRWARISGNPLARLVGEWRHDLTLFPRLTRLPRKKILFVIGGLSNIPEHGLATSFVLAHRNCDVDVVWFSNVLAHKHDDNYSQRRFNYYYSAAFNVQPDSCEGHKFIRLPSVEASGLTPEMVKEAEAQAFIDVIYATCRETIDIEDRDKDLYEHRVQINCELMARLLTLIKQNKYDVLVTPNGAVLEYGAAYRLSRQVNLAAGSYEFWNGPGKAAASHGPNVLALDTEELWQEDAPHFLSPERRERALATLRERLKTQDGGLNREKLNELLALKPNAPLVLICPNVPFDGMFLGKTSVFSSMREWLVATARHLANSSQTANIVVRSHPHETLYAAEETAFSIIRDTGILDRVCIIPAKSPVSTYDLMTIADLGIVYSSTTGLEMAAHGIPVVCGNHFHYNNKGFTYDPGTADEYLEIIDSILAAPNKYRLTSEQLDRALSYLDIYFNSYPVPFPWTFADFWQALEEWPVRRVMSPEGDVRFGKFFDQLLGIRETQRQPSETCCNEY